MTAWSGARRVPLVAILLAVPISGRCQPAAPDWAERLVREVRSSSYPELARKDIRIAWFTSRADYFQARFSLARFLTGRRMRYVVRVNRSPVLLDAPAEARRAIVAHELAHIAAYAKGNRLRLFRLVRLAGRRYTERFEKTADRDALRRGYGSGLKQYRWWLYDHVPPWALGEKRRDYLTPAEIDAEARSR